MQSDASTLPGEPSNLVATGQARADKGAAQPGLLVTWMLALSSSTVKSKAQSMLDLEISNACDQDPERNSLSA